MDRNLLKFVKWVVRRARLNVALLVGMFFVSLDYHLDQLMAHHIFLGEIDKLNDGKIFEHALSFD